MKPLVEVNQVGGVLNLVLSNPQKLNALDPQMVSELQSGLDLAKSDDVIALLISGRGTSFCAGGDMTSLGLADIDAGRRYLEANSKILASLRSFPKPIVAAVQGYAVGGGAEIALEADVILVASGAIFRFPDVRIGSTPASAYRLVRMVGVGKASRMILLGEDLDAQQAVDRGLAARVVSSDSLLDVAIATAREFESLSPASLRFAKQALRLAQVADGQTDLESNLNAMTLVYDKPWQRKAVQEFANRKD